MQEVEQTLEQPPRTATWSARGDQRQKLEGLRRYISRPTDWEKLLSLTPRWNVRHRLKTPQRCGATHVIVEPLDFIARLAALMPQRRVNLTGWEDVYGDLARERWTRR